VWAADGFSQHRWGSERDGDAPGFVVAGAGSAGDPAAHQREREPSSRLREDAEDQRGHAQRGGPAGAGYVCQPEEDVPGVGRELLGVSPGPIAGCGPGPHAKLVKLPQSLAQTQSLVQTAVAACWGLSFADHAGTSASTGPAAFPIPDAGPRGRSAPRRSARPAA
jgi:hypothetical protein